ncbi:hypothetical protein GH733_010768 [Mirounga leonina]|nr:hypothetical protein GH733_010768 [Mirounga leonina]
MTYFRLGISDPSHGITESLSHPIIAYECLLAGGAVGSVDGGEPLAWSLGEVHSAAEGLGLAHLNLPEACLWDDVFGGRGCIPPVIHWMPTFMSLSNPLPDPPRFHTRVSHLPEDDGLGVARGQKHHICPACL